MTLSQDQKKAIRDYFTTQTQVDAVFLYGSQATHSSNPLSDVDLGVLLQPEIPSSQYAPLQLTYIAAIQNMVHTDLVIDLKLLNEQTSLPYLHQVFQGDLLVNNHPRSTDSFMSNQLNLYFDLAPAIADYYTHVQERLDQGTYALS